MAVLDPLRPADREASSYVAEPWAGDDVAARLGVEILTELASGAKGVAFLLEDGRVLKITQSVSEAATAALLMERRQAGLDTGAFPRIDALVALDTSVVMNGDHYATRTYAMVREEAADLENGWEGGNDNPHWTRALNLLANARRSRSKGVPDLGKAAHCASHVVAAHEALSWAKRELGIVIDDIRTSNFGLVENRLVIRDFEPNKLCRALKARLGEIPTIPDMPVLDLAHPATMP